MEANENMEIKKGLALTKFVRERLEEKDKEDDIKTSSANVGYRVETITEMIEIIFDFDEWEWKYGENYIGRGKVFDNQIIFKDFESKKDKIFEELKKMARLTDRQIEKIKRRNDIPKEEINKKVEAAEKKEINLVKKYLKTFDIYDKEREEGKKLQEDCDKMRKCLREETSDLNIENNGGPCKEGLAEIRKKIEMDLEEFKEDISVKNLFETITPNEEKMYGFILDVFGPSTQGRRAAKEDMWENIPIDERKKLFNYAMDIIDEEKWDDIVEDMPNRLLIKLFVPYIYRLNMKIETIKDKIVEQWENICSVEERYGKNESEKKNAIEVLEKGLTDIFEFCEDKEGLRILKNAENKLDEMIKKMENILDDCEKQLPNKEIGRLSRMILEENEDI